MTNTEPALCTKAPITGFKNPIAAKMMATKLRANEKEILYTIARIIRLNIKPGHQPNQSLHSNRNPAQHNGNPCRIERQRAEIKEIRHQSQAPQNQANFLSVQRTPTKNVFNILI